MGGEADLYGLAPTRGSDESGTATPSRGGRKRRAWTWRARPSGRRKSSGTWTGRESRPPNAGPRGSLSGIPNLYAAAQDVVPRAVRQIGRWTANPVWRGG